jgi:hypothetical protein
LQCPADTAGPAGHTLVGCVAISMAQVMYYFRYPESGVGNHSYHLSKYGMISADFGNAHYNWDEMVNYTYFFQNPEIAELVFHCGVSVEMSYSPIGSGAYTIDCVDALTTYFKYSENAKYITRADTNIRYVDSLISSLDQGLPVIYTGGSFGGHAFVCDGYNDAGFFHFNFGWGGIADGYYHLEAIVPSGINLTTAQAAIINIKPKENHPQYCSNFKEYTAKEGTIDDGSNYLDYQPNSDCQHLITCNDPGVSSIMIVFKKIDTEENVDLIRIYDGNSINSPLLATLSGQQYNTCLTSSSNEMLVEFISDSQNEGDGWFAEYIAFNDDETLSSIKKVKKGTICSLAVRVHKVRLIDNIKLA